MPLDPLEKFARDYLPWIYFFLLSAWGGITQYATKVRAGEPWSWANLGLDLIVSSFAGLLAFFVCNSLDITGYWMAFTVAVSAHEGTRAIGIWLNLRNRIIEKQGMPR